MQRNDPLLRPGNGTRSMGRIPPIEPHFRRGWFPAEKEGPSRETRTFFLFRPALSEPGQLFAGHLHLDAPERIAPDFIRIVTENDAFGRDEEILRRGDVFGAEPGGNEPFVVPNVVLFVEFPADQPAEALQLVADTLDQILRIGQQEMGRPVEIEFAVNMDPSDH